MVWAEFKLNAGSKMVLAQVTLGVQDLQTPMCPDTFSILTGKNALQKRKKPVPSLK